jgi:hypothetical protein
MIRTRILAAGGMLAAVAFVAALVASPVNAQPTSTSSPSGSSSDGEPHTNVSGPHTQAAMFTQCPAIGADTGCAILLVINANGTVSVQQDVAQGPYDGSEDSLIGVQNNTSISVSHLDLTSTNQAFGFDGDGICTFTGWPGQTSCPFGTTGYEGPNTSFSNISADTNSGTVNFPAGLAPGGHVFFSLEHQITASGLVVLPVTVPPTPPPPATVVVVSPKFTG